MAKGAADAAAARHRGRVGEGGGAAAQLYEERPRGAGACIAFFFFFLLLAFSFFCVAFFYERVLAVITGVHSNQDQILLVNIREYLGFILIEGPDYYGPP